MKLKKVETLSMLLAEALHPRLKIWRAHLQLLTLELSSQG